MSKFVGFCLVMALINLLVIIYSGGNPFSIAGLFFSWLAAGIEFTWNQKGDRGSIGVGWLIAIGAAVLVVLPMGIWGFRVATAPIKGAGDQRIQTNEVNYRIAAYDKFFNLCSAVKSQESNLNHLSEELSDTVNPPTVDRKNQLLTFITASKNQRSELINQYNADATKTGTLAQFHASTLPYQIQEDGVTVCVVS